MVQLSRQHLFLEPGSAAYDAVLIFKDGTQECHRVLLAALSPFLRGVLKVN